MLDIVVNMGNIEKIRPAVKAGAMIVVASYANTNSRFIGPAKHPTK